jgi:hypothetical protein
VQERRKPNRALDRQPRVGDTLAQIRQRPAGLRVLIQFVNPRLDPGIAGFRSDIDVRQDVDLFPLIRTFANRARVQAVAKRIRLRGHRLRLLSNRH